MIILRISVAAPVHLAKKRLKLISELEILARFAKMKKLDISAEFTRWEPILYKQEIEPVSN